MTCVGCGGPVAPHEEAQPTVVAGIRFTVPSLCTGCCHAAKTTPGGKAALDRLAAGVVDEAAAADLAELTRLPFEDVLARLDPPVEYRFEIPDGAG